MTNKFYDYLECLDSFPEDIEMNEDTARELEVNADKGISIKDKHIKILINNSMVYGLICYCEGPNVRVSYLGSK